MHTLRLGSLCITTFDHAFIPKGLGLSYSVVRLVYKFLFDKNSYSGKKVVIYNYCFFAKEIDYENMKYIEAFKLKIKDPKFKADVSQFKNKWGLDQNRFETIKNWYIDSNEKFPKNFKGSLPTQKKLDKFDYFKPISNKKLRITGIDIEQFFSDIDELKLVHFNNIDRFGHMLVHYLIHNKISNDKERVAILFNQDPTSNKKELLLKIFADTRLNDIKKVWNKVNVLQRLIWQGADKKTQSSSNFNLITEVHSSTLDGKKSYKQINDKLDKKNLQTKSSKDIKNIKYKTKKKLKGLLS
jgi:hypothetical protein